MPNMLILEIEVTDDTDIVVTDTRYGHTITVDLGMNPTWPSAAEQSDLVADAVRMIMDLVYTEDTGEMIVR